MGGLDLCPEAGQRQGSRGKGQGVDAGARGSDQAPLLRLTRCVFPQVKATLIWLMLSTTPVGARVSAGGAGGRRELLCVAWVGSGLRTPGLESSRCWRWTLTPHPTDAQVRAQSCVPGLWSPARALSITQVAFMATTCPGCSLPSRSPGLCPKPRSTASCKALLKLIS